MLDGLDTLPRWVLDLITLTGTVLLVVLFVAGLVVAVRGRHWAPARVSLVSGGIAAALAALSTPVIDASARVVPDSELTLMTAGCPRRVAGGGGPPWWW